MTGTGRRRGRRSGFVPRRHEERGQFATHLPLKLVDELLRVRGLAQRLVVLGAAGLEVLGQVVVGVAELPRRPPTPPCTSQRRIIPAIASPGSPLKRDHLFGPR